MAKKGEQVHIRCDADEKELWEKASQDFKQLHGLSKLSLAEWIRVTLNAAASKQAKRSGH